MEIAEYIKSMVPELRFGEFENTHLSEALFEDVFKFSLGKNIKQNEASPEFETPCVRYGELYHMYEEVIEKVINRTNLDRSELKFSDGDEILLPSAGEDPWDIGSASALTLKDIAIGRTINILKPKKEGVYSSIYAAYFISEKRRKKIATLAQGVSISNVYNTHLHKLTIVLPTLPEQKKIADFLSAVDARIQHLGRKKELLAQYKKGVMQKLFNFPLSRGDKGVCKEGLEKKEHTPDPSQEGRIRFKRPDGTNYPDWEEKRLDQLVSDFIVPMRDKPTDLTGPIPWCRIEDFDGKFLHRSKSNQGVSKETVQAMNLKVYPVNTLLVSCSANLGFCAITKEELVTNQTFIGLVPNTEVCEVQFLLYVMRKSSQKLNTLSSGTTISYLSRKQFEKFKINAPSVEEQRKIADFLSALDKKIEAVSTQIAKTQQFKKGLLQKMFV